MRPAWRLRQMWRPAKRHELVGGNLLVSGRCGEDNFGAFQRAVGQLIVLAIEPGGRDIGRHGNARELTSSKRASSDTPSVCE